MQQLEKFEYMASEKNAQYQASKKAPSDPTAEVEIANRMFNALKPTPESKKEKENSDLLDEILQQSSSSSTSSSSTGNIPKLDVEEQDLDDLLNMSDVAPLKNNVAEGLDLDSLLASITDNSKSPETKKPSTPKHPPTQLQKCLDDELDRILEMSDTKTKPYSKSSTPKPSSNNSSTTKPASEQKDLEDMLDKLLDAEISIEEPSSKSSSAPKSTSEEKSFEDQLDSLLEMEDSGIAKSLNNNATTTTQESDGKFQKCL